MAKRRVAMSCLALAGVIGALFAAPAVNAQGDWIVGGAPVALGEIPYQVVVSPAGGLCGGTVLTTTTVLTAAHCFEHPVIAGLFVAADEVVVGAGFSVLGQIDAEGGTRARVHSYVIHPDYAGDPGANDLAIVYLADPIPFGPNLQPIALASAAELAAATTGRISGWGVTEFEGDISTTLLSAIVPVLSAPDCVAFLQDVAASPDLTPQSVTNVLDLAASINPTGDVCAGDIGVDTCQGDSGGPLAINVGGIWKLAGIASRGINCGVLPGVYTAAPAYLSWISAQVASAPSLGPATPTPVPPPATPTAVPATPTALPATPTAAPVVSTATPLAATPTAAPVVTTATAQPATPTAAPVAVTATPQPTPTAIPTATPSTFVPAAAAQPTSVFVSAAQVLSTGPLVTADTNGFQPIQATAPQLRRAAATAVADAGVNGSAGAGELALTGASDGQLTLAQWGLMGAIMGLLVFGSPVMYRARRASRISTLLEQVPPAPAAED